MDVQVLLSLCQTEGQTFDFLVQTLSLAGLVILGKSLTSLTVGVLLENSDCPASRPTLAIVREGLMRPWGSRAAVLGELMQGVENCLSNVSATYSCAPSIPTLLSPVH